MFSGICWRLWRQCKPLPQSSQEEKVLMISSDFMSCLEGNLGPTRRVHWGKNRQLEPPHNPWGHFGGRWSGLLTAVDWTRSSEGPGIIEQGTLGRTPLWIRRGPISATLSWSHSFFHSGPSISLFSQIVMAPIRFLVLLADSSRIFYLNGNQLHGRAIFSLCSWGGAFNYFPYSRNIWGRLPVLGSRIPHGPITFPTGSSRSLEESTPVP